MLRCIVEYHNKNAASRYRSLGKTQILTAFANSRSPHSYRLWNEHLKLWQRTTERLLGLTNNSDHRPVAIDRRFEHPAWTEHVLFDYIKQSYMVAAEAILSAVKRVDGLHPKRAHKVNFYTKQFVDAMAPSNFLATNPEVLQTTLETGGENLLRGLTNLLDDLELGRGRLVVTMADLKAFRVG